MRAIATIDTSALQSNLQQVRRHAPGSRVLAVIKANAYGHGMHVAAQALDDADAFAVACVEEGLELRRGGCRKPIVVLEGVLNAEELQVAVEQELQLVVHQAEQVSLLEQLHTISRLQIWLKIDTGMHRLGLDAESFRDAFRRVSALSCIERPIRLMSHFANADDRADTATSRQLQQFLELTDGLPDTERSIANSAGLCAWPEARLEWVRPGIMLYGVNPFVDGTAADQSLRPAMTLRCGLIAVQQRRKGDAIGYGGTWICPEDMPVGVASVGYGDGYPRHAPPGTPVLVGERRVSLVGRVSMDMICLDLRNAPAARVGDPVTCWGEGLPVEAVAQPAGTIAYELLCKLTGRVGRRIC